MPFNWVSESGPSGSTPDPTPYSGQGKLHVDPAAIPSLRKAFERALDKLTPQVNQARTDLRVSSTPTSQGHVHADFHVQRCHHVV